MPSTLALIRGMFTDPRQRTTAFGVWTASFALGGVLAPVVAGILLRHFWWGSVFLFGVPLIAVLLALGPVLLPELRDRDAARIDSAGAALSLAGVLSAVYGLKRAVQGGVDPVAGIALAIGLCLVAAFLRRQHRQADPWIDLALFRRRDFSLPLGANAVCFFVLYGTQFFIGAVPPARARALGAPRRSLDDPVGAGLPGRLRARPRGGESAAARVDDDARAWRSRPSASGS